VFEYDSRQHVALYQAGPPVCLRRAGSLRMCPEWTLIYRLLIDLM